MRRVGYVSLGIREVKGRKKGRVKEERKERKERKKRK